MNENCINCETCDKCSSCNNCFTSYDCIGCDDCVDCDSSFNCTNVVNGLYCSGLRFIKQDKSKYYIRNKKVEKATYKKIIKQLKLNRVEKK